MIVMDPIDSSFRFWFAVVAMLLDLHRWHARFRFHLHSAEPCGLASGATAVLRARTLLPNKYFVSVYVNHSEQAPWQGVVVRIAVSRFAEVHVQSHGPPPVVVVVTTMPCP